MTNTMRSLFCFACLLVVGCMQAPQPEVQAYESQQCIQNNHACSAPHTVHLDRVFGFE